MPRTNTASDQIFKDAIAHARQQREMASRSVTTKLSSPQDRGKGTPMERLRSKASAARKRNAQARLIGAALRQMHQTGFQKVAMDMATGGSPGSGNDTDPLASTNGSSIHNKSEPVATHEVDPALQSGNNPDTSNSNPIVTRSGRGGEGYTMDQGDLSQVNAPDGDPVRRRRSDSSTDMAGPGDNTEIFDGGADGGTLSGTKQSNFGNVRDGLTGNPRGKTAQKTPKTPKASQLLAKVSGGKALKNPHHARQWCSRVLDIHGPEDACFVLKQSAIRHGIQAPTDDGLIEKFSRAIGLELPDRRAEWRQDLLLEKMSMGLGQEQAEVQARTEVDRAKDTVEAVVKAQGELPTTTQVAEAAGVSPTAANVAIFETAELIASTNGQVAAPGQASAAMPPAPMPGGMGDPGAMPPAPMPPAGAPPMPPPMDPAMAGGGAMPPVGAPPAAPVDPAAAGGVPPQQMPVASGIHPQRLRGVISQIMQSGGVGKFSTVATIDTPPESSDGAKSKSERTVEAGHGATLSDHEERGFDPQPTKDMLSADQASVLQSAFGSNASQVTTGPQDVAPHGEPTHINNEVQPAGDGGVFDTKGEQVSGTEGVDANPSGQGDGSSKTSADRGEDLVDELMGSLWGGSRYLSKRSEEKAAQDAVDDASLKGDDRDKGKGDEDDDEEDLDNMDSDESDAGGNE